jgi:hypothetical protein
VCVSVIRAVGLCRSSTIKRRIHEHRVPDAVCLRASEFTHLYRSLTTSRSLDLSTSRSRRALISYLALLWWSGWIRMILVRLLHSLQSTSEIATAKVYEVMHVNMQQGQWRKLPRSDGDGFCLAAPLAVAQVMPCR